MSTTSTTRKRPGHPPRPPCLFLSLAFFLLLSVMMVDPSHAQTYTEEAGRVPGTPGSPGGSNRPGGINGNGGGGRWGNRNPDAGVESHVADGKGGEGGGGGRGGGGGFGDAPVTVNSGSGVSDNGLGYGGTGLWVEAEDKEEGSGGGRRLLRH